MSVVANTTVISNFAAIDQLALLHGLFGELAIPTEVYDEIREGLAEGYAFYAGIEAQIIPLADGGWIRLVSLAGDEELRLFATMPAGLHRGEAACLAIAHQRTWLLLTDDRAARAEAARRGIALSGSIGCLVLAVEHNLLSLDQANALLGQMVTLGYHTPVSDLSGLVQANPPKS